MARKFLATCAKTLAQLALRLARVYAGMEEWVVTATRTVE